MSARSSTHCAPATTSTLSQWPPARWPELAELSLRRSLGYERSTAPENSGLHLSQNRTQETEAEHAWVRDDDVAVPMREDITLLADVHRPATPGRYPVLVAASPYPRQIQDLGAPLGFIEAGQTDVASRSYVHVIANLRGPGGSSGTFEFLDTQERGDLRGGESSDRRT
jgi:uncharacterized protein